MDEPTLVKLIKTLKLTPEQQDLLRGSASIHSQIKYLESSFQAPKHGSTHGSGAQVTIPYLDEPDQPQASDADAEPSERYVHAGRLGVGGMGVVYRVRDTILQRTVAMKVIHRELLSTPRLARRFVKESQIGAQLQHPNIVPVYDRGQLPDGRHYFTMKQIQGRPFTAQIRNVHASSDEHWWSPTADGVSFRGLIQTFHKIVITIAYAHSRGVIHRDLKPDNIMIGGFGEVLVVDWGIAKILGTKLDEVGIQTDRARGDSLETHSGSIAGTPNYMAPEQAQGRIDEIGVHSDIYALGAMLYEILSGAPPFAGQSADEILSRAGEQHPTSLRSSSQHSPRMVPPKRPEPLIAICEHAMAHAPSGRPSSAEALAENIQDWLEGAERRDRALEEVAEAKAFLVQADEQDAIAAACWEEAQQRIEKNGVDDRHAWERWHASRAAAAQTRQLRRRHQQRLQGALAHTPTLTEAHHALAQLSLEDVVQYTARGEHASVEAAQQQLAHHLSHLPDAEQEALQHTLLARQDDAIVSERARRGMLIGRHTMTARITATLRDGQRLLSLLGTPGVGKTQLALEVAEALRGDIPRIVFCNLTEASDTLGILRLTAAALNVHLQPDASAHLIHALQSTPTLLILDNLEQVIDDASAICALWLEQAPDLQLLVTSRVKLSLPTEQTIQVQPLSLLASMELFAHRGQAANSSFTMRADNRTAVSTLVQQLDRLPLAIELAAARLRTLSLDELRARLGKRFALLRSRRPDQPALLGALDWSWDLLEPWTRSTLSQISQFHGGFQLSAAESVVTLDAWPDHPPLYNVLEQLIDNSLLRQEQREGGAARYDLLESVRDYAAQRLDEAGEVVATRARHAMHFAQFGDARAHPEQVTGWAEQIRDLDNLVIGIEYGDRQSAPLCCLAALRLLSMRGPISLGIEIADRVLRMEHLPPQIVRRLELERSKYLRISGRISEARATIGVTESSPSQSSAVPPATASDPLEGVRLLGLGELDLIQSRYDEALRAYQASADIFQQHHEHSKQSEALCGMGTTQQFKGDFERAAASYTAALSAARKSGDRRRELIVLGKISGLAHERGDIAQARADYSTTIDICRELGDRRSESIYLGNLGNLEFHQGNLRTAEQHYTQALHIARDIGDRRHEGLHLGNLGELLFSKEELEEAEERLRCSIETCREFYPVARIVFQAILARLLAERGQHEEAAALISVDVDAVDLGHMEQGKFLCNKAMVLHLSGDTDAAQACLSVAQQIVNERQIAPHSILANQLRSTTQQLRVISLEPGEAAPEWKHLEGRRALEMGYLEWGQSKYSAAEVAFQQAISIFQELNERSHEAEAIGALAGICLSRNQTKRAKAYCLETIQIARETSNQKLEGRHLGNLGNLALSDGMYQEAMEHYSAAIRIAQHIGDRACESTHLVNLGCIQFNLGHLDQARRCYDSALLIAQSIGHQALESITMVNLGNMEIANHNLDQASGHFDRALKQAQEIGERRLEGNILGNMGRLFFLQGQQSKAEETLRRGIDICDEASPISTGEFRGTLARLVSQQGRQEEAAALLQAGMRAVEHNPMERAKLLCCSVHIHHQSGADRVAQQALEAAQQIAVELQVTAYSTLRQHIREAMSLLLPPE